MAQKRRFIPVSEKLDVLERVKRGESLYSIEKSTGYQRSQIKKWQQRFGQSREINAKFRYHPQQAKVEQMAPLKNAAGSYFKNDKSTMFPEEHDNSICYWRFRNKPAARLPPTGQLHQHIYLQGSNPTSPRRVAMQTDWIKKPGKKVIWSKQHGQYSKEAKRKWYYSVECLQLYANAVCFFQ